jgi:hypothetical protein
LEKNHLAGKKHMRMECPQVRKDVVISKLGQEIMVCDPSTDRLHILNRTASFIWDMADGRHSPGEIADAIQEAFSISPETAVAGDVSDVLAKLRQKGLLKEVRNGEGETKKTGV